MQVPEISKGKARRGQALWRGVGHGLGIAAGLVVGVGMCAGAARAEKKPAPWVQLPLESMGFPGISNVFLGDGISMLTVHFLDDSHLLVTYGLRGLVPRLPDDPVEDDDRMVAAEIVDLPSGKVEARTEWHLHDHGKYLWKLTGGRFLVRIGERFSTIAPMANLANGDAFVRTMFPSRAMKPSLVLVSPDGGVVTLETVVGTGGDHQSKVVVMGDEDTAEPVQKTMISFYRLQEVGGGLSVKGAGAVMAPEPLLLPIDADGYLWADTLQNGVWDVAFDGFGGKAIDLGKVDSSCRPRLQMTSKSEFVMLTCMGEDDKIKVASYGLDGR